MTISVDVSQFHPHNITDTCAVWNVLSSKQLFASASQAGVCFYCTRFVIYECLHKPRKTPRESDAELQKRLTAWRGRGCFEDFALDLQDLQDLDILEKRKRLGKGELASMVLARKYQLAFMTDDQKARKLAADSDQQSVVQTTVHLLGWLFFHAYLSDSNHKEIVDEHTSLDRPLATLFTEVYEHAMSCRLMSPRANQ